MKTKQKQTLKKVLKPDQQEEVLEPEQQSQPKLTVEGVARELERDWEYSPEVARAMAESILEG